MFCFFCASLYMFSSELVCMVYLYTIKADMNCDIPFQTAAIFFLTNFYLKQGIG